MENETYGKRKLTLMISKQSGNWLEKVSKQIGVPMSTIVDILVRKFGNELIESWGFEKNEL